MTLRDEHLVPVVGIEQTEVEIAIVYEYQDGKDLRSLMSLAPLKHLRIPPAVALHVALSSITALGEIRRGLPEELRSGSLTPDSVFVEADGSVRLLDAGVIAAISRAPGAGKYDKLAGYAAPEEFDGEIAEKTDVFRLGVLLWEMLSAKRLFGGVTSFAIIEQVKNLAIPPVDDGEPRPELAELSAVVHRALERDPSARPSLDELEAELSGCGIAAATDAEVALYLEELTGTGLAAQRRAVTTALARMAAEPVEAEVGTDSEPLKVIQSPSPNAAPKGSASRFRPPVPVKPPRNLARAGGSDLDELQRDSELPTAIQEPNAEDLEELATDVQRTSELPTAIRSSDDEIALDAEPTDIQRDSELPTAIKPPDEPAPDSQEPTVVQPAVVVGGGVPFARLQGRSSTSTLLGVPAPAVLPAKKAPLASSPEPALPEPLPPPRPTPLPPPRPPAVTGATLASAPFESGALDDLEGQSGVSLLDEISTVEVLEELEPRPAPPKPPLVEPTRDMPAAPAALPLHPMFQKHEGELGAEDDSRVRPGATASRLQIPGWRRHSAGGPVAQRGSARMVQVRW